MPYIIIVFHGTFVSHKHGYFHTREVYRLICFIGILSLPFQERAGRDLPFTRHTTEINEKEKKSRYRCSLLSLQHEKQ